MATSLSKEDVVRRKHRGQIQLGLVTYSYTGDSSSEDEDDDASDVVREGQARIAWYPKGREEVVQEDKVTLHDRCLLPGDIVKYNVATQTQKGLIKSINVLCHLQVLSTKQIIYNIPSQELDPILPFQAGDHVVMDDWVGIVRESYNNVTVHFKSDARCSVCEDNACRLVDVHDSSDENSVFGEEVGFFPGQILQGPAAVFKGAKWLAGPRPILGSKTRFRVTVDEVKNTGLDVQWCSRAVTKNTDDLKPPPMCIKGKNLERTKLLNFSAHASVQIGDKCMYRVKEEDLDFPESVTKGSILCFRRPGENLGAELDGASDPSAGDGEHERKDDMQSLISQAMKMFGIKMRNLKDIGTLGNTGEQNVQEEQTAQEVSGVGCGVLQKKQETGEGSENSVQSRTELSTVTPTSATEERLSGDENEEGAASKSTDQAASHDAGRRRKVDEVLATFEEVLMLIGKDKDGSHMPKCKMMVDQAGKNLRNLPSPSDIARASLKPGFSLVNGDTGKEEESESHHELSHKPKDSRLVSLFTNFTKLHNDLDTLNESLRDLASGSLQKSSYDEMFSSAQTDMHGQIRLLRQIMGSLNSSREATIKEHKHSALNVTPTEQTEDGSQEEKKEGVEEDVSSGDDVEWEEDEDEDGEEEIVKDGEQSVSDDAGNEGGGEEDDNEEDKSVKAKLSKTSSQKPAAKKSKRQKQTSTQPKKRKAQMVKGDPIQPGQWVCVEVTHTSTVVDVLWQDGTYERNIISTDVVPCRQLDELEFFPGDFVSHGKGSTEEGYGVVTHADNKERTCRVNWITKNPENLSKPITSTEEYSVYELSPHPDFVFSTDDVVVRIAHNSKEEEESAKDLPPAGQVCEVNGDGSITVRWVDDTKSRIFPHQLFKIEEEFDSELSITDYLEAAKEMIEDGEGGERGGSSGDDSTSSDSSWETASGESGEDGHEEDEGDMCEDDVSHIPDDSMSRTEPPDTEAQRTGDVETADKTEEPLSTNSDCSVLQQSITDLPDIKDHDESPSKDTDSKPTEDEEARKIKTEKEEVGMKLEITMTTEREMPSSQDKELLWDEDGLMSPNAASRFIVVPSLPSCHYFSSAQVPANQKQFLQTWRKEVRLLQTALPQGILVKAFEDRMDMFSVMIEGPVNTPYEDGVFFFDIRLLGDYPKTPPKVHYLSFCSGRLNPNLYSDGKVCLSLLGTWTGKGNEMWTLKSNLLQLLVSVQGLILVNEPYYNEAGYDKHRGTAESMENCRMYNEMALVKLVQSMTKVISSPPFLFKEEALMFCQKHSVRLLRRLESWLELAPRSEDIPKATNQAELVSGQPCEQDNVMQMESEALTEVKTSTAEENMSGGGKESAGDGVKETPPPSLLSSAEAAAGSPSKPDSAEHLLLDPAAETLKIPHTDSDSTTHPPNSTTPSSASEATSSTTPGACTPQSKPQRLTLDPNHRKMSPEAVGSEPYDTSPSPPPYSLFPLSRGFVISLRHTLIEFKSVLKQAGIS